MKAFFKNHLLVMSTATCLGAALTGHAVAQTYTILHLFAIPASGGGPFAVNSDGFDPNTLILSGDTLYGTTFQGNTNGTGTVFAINTNGSDFRLLYTFSAISCPCPNGGNNDGALPRALLLSGNTLYGGAIGGVTGSGTIFSVNTDGTGFSTVYTFSAAGYDSSGSGYYTNSDGVAPGRLILSGNTLYGAADWGGNGSGTIFAVKTDGTGFRILYNFAAGGLNDLSINTNRDGLEPNSLLLSGDRLFGTTLDGGTSGSGEVFAVNTDGTGFTILHRFTALNNAGHNSDGARPRALVLSGGTLYGTTSLGSISGAGTVFSISTNGTGFKTLTNRMSPGWDPQFQLVSAGNVLYGIDQDGMFSLNTNGSSLTMLSSNFWPQDVCLLWSGNTLYGGMGVLFSLSLPLPPPKLTITPDGNGGYLIDAQGQPNFTCQLERAPTLAGQWTTNASQTADSSGLIEFHDLFAPPDHAFYRTVQP